MDASDEEPQNKPDDFSSLLSTLPIKNQKIAVDDLEIQEEKEEELTSNIESISISISEISDDDIEETSSDNLYAKNYQYGMSQSFLDSVTAVPTKTETSKITWPFLGELIVEIPKTLSETQKFKKKIIDDEDSKFVVEGKVPSLCESHLVLSHIEKIVKRHLPTCNKKFLNNGGLTSLQLELLSLLFSYSDFYFPHRNFSNENEIRIAYCTHILNHVLSANKIIHNNNIDISKFSSDQKFVLPDDYRDQGFVRAKVLVLLPFRESAFRVVKNIQSLLYKDENALNFKRFEEEFGTENTEVTPTRKPEDYEKTFYGNIDDTFRIGISFKGTSMKLYTKFESSDIIVASPLGLRVLMSASNDSHVSSDFLSSLEILIIDQMDVLLMQNWDHLLYIMENLHLQPKSILNTNFSRVRSSVINGQTKYFRQTLLFSSNDLPEFRSLINGKCKNFRGKVRAERKIQKCSIQQIMVSVSQTFHRIEVRAFDQVFDNRFEYFINTILPVYKSSTMAHTMIFVPSYFDYVRIRNYLKSESISFTQISEYSRNDKISKARTLFYHGGSHFLLYSERSHFYRRFKIKGIRHVIFYQPPTFSNFYTEIANFMHESNQNPNDDVVKNSTITVLYTKYDNLTLAGILGHEYVGKMLNSKKITHKFSTSK